MAEENPAGVIAAYRAAAHGSALAGKGALELTYAYAGVGLTGTVATTYDLASGAFIDTADIGPTSQANGFDGRTAWMRDMSGAVTPQGGGDVRSLAITEAYLDANAWWRPGFGGASVRFTAEKTEDGALYDILQVTPAGGQPFEAWFDARTHLLARTVEKQSSQTVTNWMSAYQNVGGFMAPGKVVTDDGSGAQYRQTQTLRKAKFVAAKGRAAYGPPPWKVTDAAIANASGVTTIPFKLLNNHIYADVMVNGQGPYLCIFDTGGRDILTPPTAKALGLKVVGAAPGMGAGEGTVEFGFAHGVSFRLGDLEIRDQTISVLPFEAGEVEGFPEQGMIGFEVFRRFVTVIDYGRQTLTFIDPAKFDPKGAGTPVQFQFYNHLPQVSGTFDGIPGRFDIDTGARDELTLTKPFVEAHRLKDAHPKGVTTVEGWGVGGKSVAYVTRGGSVTLGPVRVDGPVTSFSVQNKGAFADASYAGNVGAGLLKRFVVTLDYAHQTLYLKPRPAPVPDTGVFDRSGMWINTAPDGFKVVDVTAGGAAASAGLKVGDTITAVDGAGAKSINISELRRRLRDEAPGTAVSLGVSGRSGPVVLTLQDQI
jgi:hypothetical protein